MRADFTTQVYPPHTHDGFVIAVTETGGSVIKSRGVVDEARDSALLVFNPLEPHAGWMGTSEHWRYRSFYLPQSAIDSVAQGLGIDSVPYFTRNILADRQLVGGFLALHRALEDGHELLHERELLLSSFGHLFRQHGNGGARIDPAPRDIVLFNLVTSIIEDRYAEDLRLEELASAAGITAFQLIGLFKRTAGLTPHTYLTQVRLRHACELLSRGVQIAVVAGDTGFYDQSALNKHFKRCYGITPLQFARAAAMRTRHVEEKLHEQFLPA